MLMYIVGENPRNWSKDHLNRFRKFVTGANGNPLLLTSIKEALQLFGGVEYFRSTAFDPTLFRLTIRSLFKDGLVSPGNDFPVDDELGERISCELCYVVLGLLALDDEDALGLGKGAFLYKVWVGVPDHFNSISLWWQEVFDLNQV